MVINDDDANAHPARSTRLWSSDGSPGPARGRPWRSAAPRVVFAAYRRTGGAAT
jgi:hypothetical protein